MPVGQGVKRGHGGSYSSAPVHIYGNVAIGATGAVGAQTGRGFAVVRDDVGEYTITLDGRGALPILLAEVSLAYEYSDTVYVATVQTINSTTRKVTVLVQVQSVDTDIENTATDPPSGALLQLHAVVNNVPIGRN